MEDHKHNAVPHRDGKTPWCKICGLTATYKKPESIFDRKPSGNPKHMEKPDVKYR